MVEDLRNSCEDVRIRPVRRAHLDQGVRGAEAGSALAAANVSLWGGLRESAMLALRSVPLGGCSESAVLDPMQPVPDSGDREPSRFLGGKQLEKPETDSIIAERPCERKGFGASPPKVFGIVSRNPKPAP